MSPVSQVLRIKLERADVAALVRDDDVLKGAPLVKALGARAEAVLKQSTGLRFADQAAVFHQGDIGDSLFLVLKGELRVSAMAGSDVLELGVAQRADVVGETEALGSQATRCVQAVAQGEAELAEIPRQLLLDRGQLPAPVNEYLHGLHLHRQAAIKELSDFLGRW